MLKQGVWYEIRTRINNREPLFRRYAALVIFARVFRETRLRFAFEVRGLHLTDDWLTFYVKPADGLELPAIMKWLKQVFAQRYNRADGRIGHLWGDRYGSRILEGEPAVEEDAAAMAVSTGGVRPCGGGEAAATAISTGGVRPRGGGEAAATAVSTGGVRPQGGERAAGTAISTHRVRPQSRKWAAKPAFPPVVAAAPG